MQFWKNLRVFSAYFNTLQNFLIVKNVNFIVLCKKYTLFSIFFVQNSQFLNVKFCRKPIVKKVK